MNIAVIWIEPTAYVLSYIESFYRPRGMDSYFLQRNTEAKSEGISLSSFCFLREMSWLKRTYFLWNLLKRYDCIMINGYTIPEFVVLWIMNLFCKRTLAIMSDTQYRRPRGKCRALLKNIYLKTVFRCKHLYGLPGGTRSHRQAFLRYGMPDSRVMLLPMVINNVMVKCRNPHLPIKRRNFRFLYVGRMVPIKNLDFMVSVFCETFPNAGAGVELHMVGNGELLPVLQVKYGNLLHVVFHGSLFGTALSEIYAGADALLLVSHHDQWGLVVNEAMAAGLPVIVSSGVGAHFDLVDHRDTGYVFEAGNREEFRRRLELMVKQPEHYLVMSQNARRLLWQEWNYDLYAACLDDFLTAVEKKRHAS